MLLKESEGQVTLAEEIAFIFSIIIDYSVKPQIVAVEEKVNI